jgi:RNA polymerase sigma factor (sigma-70 family)
VSDLSTTHADASTAQMAAALLHSSFLRERPGLWRFLRFKTGDDQTADDLLQDMWLRVNGAPGKSLRDPEAFLRMIARNLVIDWRRKQAVIGRHSAPFEDGMDVAVDAPSAFDILASRQAFALLVRIIEDLPPRQRKAFILYRFGGLTMVEVADRMGVTVRTVERQVAVALSQCQIRLMAMGWVP